MSACFPTADVEADVPKPTPSANFRLMRRSKFHSYSIISSGRASTLAGMSRPALDNRHDVFRRDALYSNIGARRFGRQFESQPQDTSALALSMEASGQHVHPAAVGVVGGVADELIVEAHAHGGGQGVGGVGVEDFFVADIRQWPVTGVECQ